MPTFTGGDRAMSILGTIGLGNQVLGNGCNNGGLLGNLFGNNNGNDCVVTEKEFSWAQKCNALEAQNAKLESENFTRQAATKAFEDSVAYAASLDNKQSGNLKELYSIVISQGNELIALKGEIACNNKIFAKDMEIVEGKIEREAERRKSGDENIVAWTQGELNKKANVSNYIDGRQVFCPDNSICGGNKDDVTVVNIDAMAAAFATAFKQVLNG